MIVHKEVSYVLQHMRYKTYYVSYSKSDTTEPVGGMRFMKEESALYFRDEANLFKHYNVKKLTITVEVDEC